MNKFRQIIFLLFLGCFIQIYGQQDCSNALPICTDANSGGVVNGFGYDDFNGATTSGCLRTGLGVNTIETNSFWFKVKLAESGEFGFNIIPNDTTEDWDFAVYGPNRSCGSLGDPIKCNYSKVSSTGYTGVGNDPSTGNQTEAYDSYMTVTAGDEYLVFVNQYAGGNTGFSLQWTGAVIDTNTEPLDCDILVDLGPDRNLCIGESTSLNATIFGSTVTYKWYKDGVILAETGPVLSVNSTGDYRVEVNNLTTGEAHDDDIVITFYNVPIANGVSDMVVCDVDGDGVEAFDLNTQSSGIINGQPNMSVTYHEFELFAMAKADPQTSPYVSGNSTIWARIENSNNGTCYDITSFNLVVTTAPKANLAPDLLACDNDNDGFMLFDLDEQTPIILDGQPAFITYYDDEENAKARKGWIVNTALYNTKSTTIWARVEPSPGSSCYALTSFEIKVFNSPEANTPTSILECDFDNDGYFEFDFRSLKDAEILGIQNPAIYEINYFSTLLDAENNTNNLPIPYTNKSPYNEETIYARIQNIDYENCYSITNFTLQVFDSSTPPSPEEIPELTYCDDIGDGDDTNGFISFDLTERETTILNGQSQYVFDVAYFEDSEYLIEITNPTSYTNVKSGEQTIYVRVTNSNPNNVDCYSNTSFIIKVKPLPTALSSTYDFKQCDEDGTPDGFVIFNLNEADYFVSLGDNSLNVSYHLSPLNAASGTNAVSKNDFSNSISNTLYARVTSDLSCYRIVPINLIVSVTSFPSFYKRELIQCDDDGSNDGLHVFDLAQTRSEIMALFLPNNNLEVSYFRNSDDAIRETNIINPENAYLSEVAYSQEIWVRVESTIDGGCFGVSPVIELVVNNIPEFELEETGVICLNDLPETFSIQNPTGFFTYEWLDGLGNIVSQLPDAELNEGGVYTVVATSNLGCVSFPKEIIIEESIIANITPSDVQINNTSKDNSITIITENNNLGIGDYEFSLDDIYGPYQDDNTFDYVAPGEYTIYVREKNGCGIAQVKINVFGFPKFFTPNDDGANDTWNVLGIDRNLFPDTVIYIYDRYGKMITTIAPEQDGWDGFYGGEQALSTDYWYLAKLIDTSGNIQEYKGHFSLIRR